MKVIIVDDEIRIGNLIRNLVEWDRLGLELTGVYQNGYDVLAHFEKEPADILICDIEMPEITGLELIRRISSAYPATRCVIVSGFRDFEYARQAMQYGVDHYILKPIDEDELNNTLSTICRASMEEREKSRAERNTLFQNLLNGTFQPMTLQEVNRKYGFTFAGDAFFFVKITAESEEALEPVLAFLMARAPLLCSDLAFFGRDRRSVSAFVNLNASAGRDSFTALLREASAQGTGKAVYIFMGEDFSDLRDLAREYARINRAAWQRLFLNRMGVYSVSAETGSESVSLTESENNRLMKAVESTDREVFSGLIREIFHTRLPQFQKTPCLVEQLSEIVAMSVFNKLYNLGVRSNDFSLIRDSLFEKLNAAHKPDDVVDALVEVLFGDIQNKLVVYKDEENDYVRQARHYILKNYNRNISLETLAEELRLNQSYVSSIFKDGTGINFKQYLTDVRMDNAKRLLRETNMNISQIAGEVGYKNAFYFTNTFTSHEGIKPQEYRRIHRSIK